VTARRDTPEPGELVYAPRPSWLPAVFAFAIALTVCGIFIEFMAPGWAYSIAGGLIALGALRGMVRGALREYRRLPPGQRVRGAVLPVEPIRPPQS
jgi:hypothetical protein